MTPHRCAIGVRVGLLVALFGVGIGGSACEDSGVRCVVNGVSHRVGESFSHDCNTCTCMGPGTVTCTERACLGDAAIPDAAIPDAAIPDAGIPDAGMPRDQTGDGAACDFSSSYEYGAIGGLRLRVDRSFLSPGNQYRHTRTSPIADAGAALACAPDLRACGALDLITAYDIEIHDLPLADVRSALAQSTPPLFGYDPRPVDGTVFEFKRADGRGFLVGESCASTTAPCTPISAGIAQIKQRLLDLDTQQLAAPECQALR